MPRGRVGEAEVHLGASADVEQLGVLAVAVARVYAERERAGAAVEYRERAERRLLRAELRALLEQVRGALDQQDRAREHDRQEQLAGEREAVVGQRPQGHAGAERHTPATVGPLRLEVGGPGRAAVIP